MSLESLTDPRTLPSLPAHNRQVCETLHPETLKTYTLKTYTLKP